MLRPHESPSPNLNASPAEYKGLPGGLRGATDAMRLILAPMEGVMDAIMRDLLTGLGGYDRCVTEFIRVSQTVLPPRVFYRHCPELREGGLTASGTPVFVQLLGSNPSLMARNAQVAVNLGAPGIDLNFGCPAKTVNKSHGGATLLKTPQAVSDVCRAVRDAVNPSIPVTAKIRLGYDHDEDFERIAAAVVEAGINELTVHARTRRQGYRPPAHWHRLASIVQGCPIPVIANGELWSPTDIHRCRQISGCEDVMLARGALCRPDLAQATRAVSQGISHSALTWSDIVPMLRFFMHTNAAVYEQRYSLNPLKQWLVYLGAYYPQAAALFADVKRIKDFTEMDNRLTKIGASMEPRAA